MSSPTGKLILLIGPSGSGKGKLLEYLKKKYPEWVFAVSSTTRLIRPGEKEGETYWYITREEFEAKIKKGAFLEWAEYGGNLYGTDKRQILDALGEGKTVIREVEVQGVESILKILPREMVKVIYVDAGTWEQLEKRIVSRAPLSAEELSKRRDRYFEEIKFKDRADRVIENVDGSLKGAKMNLQSVIDDIINDQ
jgi:guanylate kinase